MKNDKLAKRRNASPKSTIGLLKDASDKMSYNSIKKERREKGKVIIETASIKWERVVS